MPITEIVQFLKEKIYRYEVNIQRLLEEIMKAQPGDMGEHSVRLMEESRKIVGSGDFTSRFEEEYESVLSLSSNWCIVAE
jgi:hypothetical protein